MFYHLDIPTSNLNENYNTSADVLFERGILHLQASIYQVMNECRIILQYREAIFFRALSPDIAFNLQSLIHQTRRTNNQNDGS